MKNVLISLLVGCVVATSHATEGLFSFVLPWDDASPGVANVSAWLARPAGGSGFVISKDGHFYEGDKRIRFLGVNTAFGANFPTHEDAEKIAARMAKFGINCVRFHHMDMLKAPAGIMKADMKTLDPGQLDKLDYFIAQLKEHGIYSNLNLHVSRVYPDMPPWENAPSFLKGVDLFYPPMLEQQRDYARQLLTHVNPYTKNAYVSEPAVALIEINNENGLLLEWWGNELQSMPDAYRNEFTQQWNDWLSKKYKTQEDLKAGWQEGTEVLGDEMVKEGDFSKGVSSWEPWILEQHGTAKAAVEKNAEGGIQIRIQQTGAEPWHVQLSQAGLSLDEKRSYTLAFRAKADPARKININLGKAGEPWTLVWTGEFELTSEWKDYRVVFSGENESKGRIVVSGMGAKEGSVWLGNVSLKTGGVAGMGENEVLGSVPIFSRKEFGSRSHSARRDWMTFLWDVEEKYWLGMADFVKKDLKAGSLIVGTATGFSPAPIQAKLDVVDSHAYWQHPHFAGKSWDPENWTVDNVPMAGAGNGGAFSGMALRRVAGKPFICTEYNAASPNTHPGETFLILSAYASLQDWDGIFAFAWSHRFNDWDARKICSFFDIDQHPVKMATMPASAAIFLRGDVQPARKTLAVPITRREGIDLSLKWGPWWDLSAFKVSKNAPLQFGTVMRLVETPEALPPIAREEVTEGILASDTNELTWDLTGKRVLINTEKSKAVIGQTGKGKVDLGDVSVEIAETLQSWATISLTVMEGTNFHSTGKILLTASGYAENTNMGWKTPEKKSVGKNWGNAPSLVEGIKAQIILPALPAKVKAWALDGNGQRTREVPVQASGSSTLLAIDPQYQTLWYEVVVE